MTGRFVPRAHWLLPVVLAAGCSSIPGGGDPALAPELRRIAAAGGSWGRVAIARVSTFSLAEDESAKGWGTQDSSRIRGEEVARELVRALEGSRVWERVRRLEGTGRGEVWTGRDDYLLEVSIEGLRTRFDGQNALWVPNIINFFLNGALAWWVATEEYSLELEVGIRLATDSGTTLATRRLPLRVGGTFDSFDRGWQFFGVISPTLDQETWLRVAEQLFPAIRHDLSVAVACEADRVLRGLGPAELASARRKTLLLAVGVTHYQDALDHPPVPYAAGDAQAVAGAFLRAAPPEQVRTLLDGQATLAGLASSIEEHLGRARDEDEVVLYFAGYGTRLPDGTEALLLPGAQGQDALLPLPVLEGWLARGRGKKLLVIDAGFDGRGRSLPGAHPPAREGAQPGLAVLLAGRPNVPVHAPEHRGHGLFTTHLLHALAGAADGDEDGRVGPGELQAWLAREVAAESALLGADQVPSLRGDSPGFELPLLRVSGS